MQPLKLGALATFLLCAALSAASAATFEALETPNLTLLHFPQEAYIAPYAARAFENALQFESQLFGWKGREKTTVILTDYSDKSNGSANPGPLNQISLFIASDDHTLEQSLGGERMFSVLNHELVHLATLDAANDTDRRWRRFFGGKPLENADHPESILYNYLALPRFAVPRWYREGIAVFMETWMAGGIGRAQSGFDEMAFRAKVRDGAHFFSHLGIESAGTTTDFMAGTNFYLYGTRFFSYLALTYSPEQVIQWMRRDADSERYYADQFEKVFGLPLDTAWTQWIDWEQRFQQQNLQKIQHYPITPVRKLAPKGMGSVSRLYLDAAGNALVGAFSYPGVLPHVGAVSLADGTLTRLAEIKGPTKWSVASTAFDPVSRTLFYTADNHRHRSLMALELDSGTPRLLLEAARIGDLAFNPQDRALWGLRQDHGLMSLVRMAQPYTAYQTLVRFPYGKDLQQLDVSPDGSLLTASVIEISGKASQQIFRTADLLEGRFEPIKQFDFGQAIPEGFVFTPDGQQLYGTAYFTGVSNIFRYDLQSGDVAAVSNAETGFFRPLPQADGSVIALEFTGDGFLPVRLDPKPLDDLGSIDFLGTQVAQQHPVVRSWGAGSPEKIDLEARVTARGQYRPQQRMTSLDHYPIIEGYRNAKALGWHSEWADPLQLHSLSASGSVSPAGDLSSSERVHARIDYSTLNWHLAYGHNAASFYDLFGPTKTGLRGDAVTAGYSTVLIFDEPRRLDFTADLAYYTGLSTAPGNQNVDSTASTIRSLKLGLFYSNTRSSANAVDAERGVEWDLTPTIANGAGATILGINGTFSAGLPLPVDHASIWLRTAGGIRNGERQNSLANFYFGAFKNNFVDNGSVQRYRNADSFPGFQIDQLQGQSFGRAMLELSLPPYHFEAVGTPAFYLGYLRPAVFTSVLVTDPGNTAYQRTLRNVGTQLDLTFLVNHGLPMTLSAGYAHGTGGTGSGRDEWMVSLKILGK